jgi:hypothetical protein
MEDHDFIDRLFHELFDSQLGDFAEELVVTEMKHMFRLTCDSGQLIVCKRCGHEAHFVRCMWAGDDASFGLLVGRLNVHNLEEGLPYRTHGVILQDDANAIALMCRLTSPAESPEMYASLGTDAVSPNVLGLRVDWIKGSWKETIARVSEFDHPCVLVAE